MKLFLIGGFLGSGKTTAIQQACSHLISENVKVAVVTNDQGNQLVDTGFIKSAGIPVEEVSNGCFCCNYNQLTAAIQSLSQTQIPQIIFAESVGSCTDLVATIAKPLVTFHPEFDVVISVFADAVLLHQLISGNASFLSDDIRYIYKKQLEEADIIILNKVDLLTGEELISVERLIEKEYPDKIVLRQNSLDQKAIQHWLSVLNAFKLAGQRRSLQIDYDIYAQGEAALAWLDEELVIETGKETAWNVASSLINQIEHSIRTKSYPIGHLKFLLDDGKTQRKISYTTVSKDANLNVDDKMTADKISLLINARVEVNPEQLNEIVGAAIEDVAKKEGCEIEIVKSSFFRPGYPRPTHRIEN